MTYDEAARALAKFESLEPKQQELVRAVGCVLVDLSGEQIAFLDIFVRSLIADQRKKPSAFEPVVACLAACQFWNDKKRKPNQ